MSLMGTAVSGMLGDTAWLSNISQNVANANTTGYKNAETEFATVVDQVGSASSAGGGVTATLRSLNTLQGSVVGTSTTTDLAIQGDGYFVVSDASGALYLTRNGSFVPDAEGNLVNSAGYYLMGYNVQDGQAAGTSNSLAGLVKVNTITSGEAATPTTTGNLAVNLPSTAVGRHRHAALGEQRRLDLHRGNLARHLRQPRRCAHAQHLLHQHRHERGRRLHLGGRRLRLRRRFRVRRLPLFGGAARDPDADLQLGQRRLDQRLAGHPHRFPTARA